MFNTSTLRVPQPSLLLSSWLHWASDIFVGITGKLFRHWNVHLPVFDAGCTKDLVSNSTTVQISSQKFAASGVPCLLLRTWLNVKCNSRYVTSTMSNKVVIKLGGKHEPGQPKGEGEVSTETDGHFASA